MTKTYAELKVENLSKDQLKDFLLSMLHAELSNLRLQRLIGQERFGHDVNNFSEKIEELTGEVESLLKWVATNDASLTFRIIQNITVEVQ